MMDTSRGVWALTVFALGACIGSFVNVVAYRLPRDISIISPSSFCLGCRQHVPFWANVPIIAWLGLRGRCTKCGVGIPFRYFLTELGLGAAASYLYLNFAPFDAFARFALCAALFAVGLIDYDWRVIPNLITFPGIPLGVLAAWLMIPEVGWRSSLIGLTLGAGFLFATGELYLRLRGKEGVGMGDVWLIGMAGAFLGLPGALFTLFGGSVLGTLGAVAFAISGGAPEPPDREAVAVAGNMVADANQKETSFWQMPIPFGPFLAIAAAIFALFQPELTDWFLAR